AKSVTLFVPPHRPRRIARETGSEVEQDLGAAVLRAPAGVVGAVRQEIWLARFGRPEGLGDNLGGFHPETDEGAADGLGALIAKADVVVVAPEGVGVAVDADDPLGPLLENLGDNLQLAGGPRGESGLVELEIEDEGVAAGGVVHDGAVGDV